MRRSTKIFMASLLSLAFALPLAACGGGSPAKPLEENIVDDQYDNYYEIFVRSFYDSDGNGIGDFKGVTEKLDYVREMGYTGIWLMPINPTDTYHGYDVKDYKAVNSAYGSMEDFEELVEKAHSLGIKIILDLVINHSSNNHPWFKQGLAAFRANNADNPDNKYIDYYTFLNDAEYNALKSSERSGYQKYGTVYAEARFGSNMPDINLDSEAVRTEFEDIIDFWIKDKKVDGFRLDAVRYFYFGNAKKSAEFTGWIKGKADEAYKEVHGEDAEAFVVGEDWSTEAEMRTFYQNAGGASFFDFTVGKSDDGGYINDTISAAMHPRTPDPQGAADTYMKSQRTVLNDANGYIPCPFLDNHDVIRIANIMSRDEQKIKFAYGLLSLYTGNTFTYYGDEIGVIGQSSISRETGSRDENVRVGLYWSDEVPFIYPSGAYYKNLEDYYLFGSIEEQLADPNSILNYYKLCNNARNAFPALMRGTPKRVENANENVLVFTKTYQEETITIVVNFSNATQTVKGLGDLTLKQGLCIEGNASGNGSSLNVPAYGIAILA